MTKDPSLPIGTLPADARARLVFASQVGAPGSMKRRIAIQAAEKWIADTYPQYLKPTGD